ncbi:MAG: cupin domain-containing protein [Lentisphaerae bacterium]|jgi:quercetin dioxygenase-like cupin family protein|nr:cupin domain-containing protein [Lentisphaerota bacterium]
MKITYAQKAAPMPNPHKINAALIYDTEHAQVVHITLEAGEKLFRHITPVDVFFFVLEGRGIVEIGDEKKEVEADALIESPAGIPHCWYNESDSRLRVMVVKVPKPTKQTQLL